MRYLLKVSPYSQQDKGEIRCDFSEKEAEALHLVGRHANIVEIVDTFEDEEAHHLIMELCAHGDLFDFISRKGRLSERLAASIIRYAFSNLCCYFAYK